jgi:aldose 1-epimerase
MSCLCVLAADAAQLPVERQPFGQTPDGRTVEVFTLRNERGMRVRFLTRGATIVEISAPDRDGKFANVALGVKNFMALDDPGDWFNSILGRYANRISNGGFTLDGRFFPLKSNVGNVVLHGGPAGFSAKLWSATILDQPAHAVRLRYVSPDGENGFPGELTVTVTYSLDEANVLQLQYEATTTKPTVVNLSNHTFFNLGGHAAGPVYGEWLQVFADRWTPTDAALVPTGQAVTVAGTPLDFRQPTPLGAHVYSADPVIMMAHGLDHNLILDPPPRAAALRLAARLWDPPSGRQMEVRTSEPGLQLYSGNGFNGEIVADDGRTLRQGDGLTFETQHFPDSPNKPDFPSTVLRPGEVFRSTTQFAFSTDREHGWFSQSGSAKAK